MRKISTLLLFLLFLPFTMLAQQSTITGVVVDNTGNGIIGATIVVQSTFEGAISGVDGEFSIKAKSGDVLEVSYMGYETITQKVTRESGNKFVLVEASTVLDDVVVVGYGAQKRSTITAAVTSLKGDVVALRPVTDLTSALQGNVAGLNFSTESSEGGSGGEPGAEISFNIRGIGSVNGGSPYILVDGVEQSMQNVNTADIASITVLKDASAAAVYGARAAYGVVLVTTKSGESGKFKVSYNGSIGLSSPIGMPDMMNSVDYANYVNTQYTNAGYSAYFSDDTIAKMQAYMENPSAYDGIEAGASGEWWNSQTAYANVDWFDYYYKDYSVRHSNNINITGGSDKINFYVGLGYTFQGGLIDVVEDTYDKYNFNTKLEAKVSDRLKFNFNNNVTLARIRRPLPNMLIFYTYAASKTPNVPTTLPVDSAYNIPSYNEFYYMSAADYDQNDISDALSLSATFTPIENWNIMGELKARFDISDKSFSLGKAITTRPDGVLSINESARQGYSYPGIAWANSLPGSYTRGSGFNYYLSPHVSTSYSKQIGMNYFSGVVGFQMEEQYISSAYMYRDGMLDEDTFSIINGNGSTIIGEARESWATMGVYTRLNWNYDERYFVEVSGRYDGSSRFAAENRWGLFPSISVGYDLAREDYFKDLDTSITQLKVRMSYGRLGNQSGAGLYDYLETMPITSTGKWLFPTTEMYASAPAMVSSMITWEKVDSANLGFDITALNNRLTVTADIYERTTRDMIGPAEAIPGISGIATADRSEVNNATLRNRGWELTVNWQDKLDSGISYGVGFNLFDYKAVVTEYNNPTGQLYNNHTGLERNQGYYQGMDTGEIWGYRADDLFQTSAEIDAYLAKVDLSMFGNDESWQRGDVKYQDINGDGVVNYGDGTIYDSGDLEIIGNATPRYSFGINFNVGYKGFELSGLLQGVGKRDYSVTGSTYLFGGSNFFEEHLDYWTADNPDAYLPRLTMSGSTDYIKNTGWNTTRYLLNAAYMRLKNVTLSYTLPESALSVLRLSHVRVYVTCDNLFTIDALPSAFDPETLNQVNWWAGGSNSTAPGLTSTLTSNGNGKVYPLNRNYVVGVDLSF